jgi:hypothetical protein
MEILIVLAAAALIYGVIRVGRHRSGTARAESSFRPEAALAGAPSVPGAVVVLGRREARLLHKHPAILIGLVVLPWLLLMAGTSTDTDLTVDDRATVVIIVPFAWAILVAAALGVLRSRRHGADELAASLPMPMSSRTAGHLLGVMTVLPLAVAYMALIVAVGSMRGTGTPRLAAIAAGPLLVVGAAMLGVATARWLPRTAAAYGICIATGILQVNLWHQHPTWRWLHFLPYSDIQDDYRELSIGRDGRHLVWLVGGAILVAAIALARSRRGRSTVVLALIATVLLAASGYAQVRPLSAAAIEKQRARLEAPAALQECVLEDGVRLCAWPRLRAVRDTWHNAVVGVQRALPPVATPLEVVMHPWIDARTVIDPDVARAVDPSVVFGRDAVVHAGFDPVASAAEQTALAYRAALTRLGLPDTVWWRDAGRGSAAWRTVQLNLKDPDTHRRLAIPSALTTCSAGGEARAVLAAWLAAQATPATRTWVLANVGLWPPGDFADLNIDDQNYTPGMIDPLPWHGTVVLENDWATARELLQRVPDSAVSAVIAAHWDELLRPSTTAARLFELGGWAAPATVTAPPQPTGQGAVITPTARCADVAR